MHRSARSCSCPSMASMTQALTSTWNEHVETFLPRGIAGLFFFDGEQIEALADLERSRQVLGSALAALLGLDLVDRLTTDLAVLRRRHRGEQVPEELRQTIEERQQLSRSIGRRRRRRPRQRPRAGSRSSAREKLLLRDDRAHTGPPVETCSSSARPPKRAAAMLRAESGAVEDEIRHELGESAPLLQVASLLQQHVEQVAAGSRGQTRRAVIVDVLTIATTTSAGAARGQGEGRDRDPGDRAVPRRGSRAATRRRRDTERSSGFTDAAAVDVLLAIDAAERRASGLRGSCRASQRGQAELDQAERVLVGDP